MSRENSDAVRTVMELSAEGREEREKPKNWLSGIE